ncbi:MAG: Dabb family protein [Pseudomonadota bacterium]
MIRHIVLFSATAEEHIDTIVETLSGYSAIPEVRDLAVSRNLKMDSLSNEFDVVLRVSFATRDDLKAYKAHPIYEEGTRIVRPLRDQRVVVDVEE